MRSALKAILMLATIFRGHRSSRFQNPSFFPPIAAGVCAPPGCTGLPTTTDLLP